jgi:spermidine/putrescine transport system ATP-binding protein
MTMADTVAVMNSGRIEQMGHPADIYELPRTVFVANFLGQSNLFQGHKSALSGDDIVVSAHGLTFAVPSTRSFAEAGNIIVGVRPEKMRVLDAIDAGTIPDHHNRITGRVTDVSYMGVSTQYLVQTPWEQEVIVFEQNVVVGDRSDVGDEVVVHWSPKHTFGLDGSSGTNVGVDPEVLELEALNVGLLDESPEA